MEELCGVEGLGGEVAAPQEPGVALQAAGLDPEPDPEEMLRAQLAAALAEVETVRAVATVSESTKQEAVAAVQRQCQEEVASLQAILKETISTYEARLVILQQEQSRGGREPSHLQQHRPQGSPLDSLERQMEKAQEDSERLRSIVLPMEEEIAQLKSKLSRAEDLIRGLQGPEVKQYQESLQQLEVVTQEKRGLQEALRRSSEDCAKQVLVLLDQIQNSEQLLQNLQATVWQTQHRTQEQIADLASSHKRLSYEVQRLSEENEGLRGSRAPLTPTEQPSLPSSVQELQALVRRLQEEAGALHRSSEHQSERLRIEIVTLRERLEEETAARARLQGVLEAQREESQLLEASLCSVRSEMERLQQQLGQAEQRAEGLEQDVQRLRGDLAQRDQAWGQEKARLEALLAEQRGKLQRLQAELDTSEQVQRDFVRLSQTLQVQLERIRQAPSLEQVRSIVDGTRLKDVAELKEP